MPVATRSQAVSSPKALRARLKGERHGDEEVKIDGTNPEHSFMRNPHYKLKEKLKSMAQTHENTAIKHQVYQIQGNQLMKSSHPSVDLFSPQFAPTGSVRKISMAKNSEEEVKAFPEQTMQESAYAIAQKTSNPTRVLGQYNWIRENRDRDSNLERLGYTCPKPPTKTTAVARRLTLAGVGQREAKSIRGQNHLEAISEGSRGLGELGSRIMVYVRLRPMAKKEKEAGSTSCVRIVNKRDIYITEHGMETDYLRLKRVRGRHFAFDASFPDNTSQEEVYNITTSELVEGVLQGRNGSVFCYGATGAGKTHTMLGTVHNPGVMVLAIKDLFMKLRQRSHDGDHVVRLSYLEVYNEAVRDLLSPGRPLVLREDKQGIVAAGLTQYQAYSTDEVMALLQQGNQNRTTEPTRMNETSSRSHAILQVVAEYKVEEGSRIVTRVGKLSLIDLAGSERALATDQRTVRSLEGANINRSLLALSSCINALVEGKKHIPYRNSKLTQLLKDSLGGVCHTVMIANISPSIHTFGETQNTLHWADRAKEIRTKACTANEDFQLPESQSEQTKLLLEVQKENQQLRMQIARYQQKMLSVQNQSLTSSPALSSSSSLLLPPSPLTPSANAGKMLDRHHTKAVQCFTPEPTPRQELSFQEAGKAAEETIQDLKRKIRALEMEAERTNKEFFMREKRLKASITDLKREHNVQLRHKDDFIRKLCKKNLLSNQATPKSPLPAEQEEILNFTQPSEKTTALKSTIMIPSASARPPPQRLQKIVPPNPVGSKTSSLPQNVCDASLRMGRRAHSPKATGTLKSPSQSHRFSSPAAGTGRKRTFWDITNANSPSAAQTRSTRSHPATAAPSMLLQLGYPCFWLMFILGPPLVGYFLQPGFARNRPSLN